ncbi:SDR family NAD(P)-dependent oxidoreductase [Lewinella sp. IMCC34183]|uniref:SDR family NAD(P)-dependent oxidoreductase n=1 Tax=Lewinella sp. IMCC34183 TaxID=2248762 RepID=UPI000E27F1C9|nr:SDR family NAD(P)-dependent oxidoreductase [Lewinella sp. IMCC34183]
MPLLALAYTHEDLSAAQRIAAAVAPAVEFEHYAVGRANDGELLADLLRKNRLPVVLLVSDSLLTNPNAMLHGVDLLPADRRVLPVIIDAHRPGPEEGEVITVHTTLHDRSDITRYVSHWQDRYIELRRGGSDYPDAVGQHAFRNYLGKIRETSIGVEEVLERILTRQPVTDADLRGDAYAPLYRFAGTSLPDPGGDAGAEPFEPEPTETMQETLTEEPLQQHVRDWIAQAWEMSDAGKTPAALELLHHSLEHQPEELELHYQYALMLALAADRLPAARLEIDSLLDNDPHYPEALFLSGELYLAEQRYQEARDDWERLYDVQADYPELNQRLGLLLAERFPAESAEAAAYLRVACKQEDATAQVLYRYAELLAGPLQREEKAISMLYRAVHRDPDHAPAHYRLAVSQFDRGENGEARKHFLRAAELEPEYDTPANRRAFLGRVTPASGAMAASSPPPTTTGTATGDALVALKQNIADLEAMLAARTDPAPAAPPRPGEGKTVLLTGATSGIGLATARRLAPDGYRLIIAARRTERLEQLAEELRDAHGTETHLLTLDVADRERVGEAIAGLPEAWSNIDILLNNAGKAKGFDPIHTGDLDHWDEMIDVNLRGLLYVTRAVTPGMVARGTGTIVNVASTAGKEVYPNGNVYCATKHAVDALTYAMRLDLVQHGIRVGQICPAHVEETEFAVVRFDGDRERARIYEDFQPLRSSDVAETIHYMISRPAHVNIMDVVLQGTQQASSTVVDRSGRERFAPREEE